MMGKNGNNILDAWIMVEHLSEGDISLKDKKNLRLDDLENKDFYGFFSSIIAGADLKKYKNGGFVFYLDIFAFSEVVDFLRKTYGIEKTESDINYGDKFSFALYFDKTMNYIGDSFFFTASAYMRYFKKVPTESE